MYGTPNGHDKAPKSFLREQYIIKFSPGLSQDPKPLRSCSGNRAKKILKSHLGRKCHNSNIPIHKGHQGLLAQFGQFLMGMTWDALGVIWRLSSSLSLLFYFVTQTPVESTTVIKVGSSA